MQGVYCLFVLLPGQCLFVFYLDNVSFCLFSTRGKTNNITVQNFHGLRGERKEGNVRYDLEKEKEEREEREERVEETKR